MHTLHLSLLAVGLFALTFLSPGPNLLVVLQASLSSGRRAGMAVGLGVAAGDAIYAALGLFGMAALITQGGALLHAIKIIGGVYLVWFGAGLIRRRATVSFDATAPRPGSTLRSCFARGLGTDLANPQTVLFFASIFAVTLRPDTPMWGKALAWTGIVTTSLLWRVALSVAFSHARVRDAYGHAQRIMEPLVGAGLGAFGVRLIYQGLHGAGER
jgi:amino acid exporter